MTIKAPRGNRAQWHANFQLDEFAAATREVRVLQPEPSTGRLQLRGLLVIGPVRADRRLLPVGGPAPCASPCRK